MSWILITLFSTPIIFFIHIFLSNIKVINKLRYLLIISFLIYFNIWLLFNYLFFFNNFEISVHIACVSLIFLFFLGYIEFFSMLCRGFSLQIICDIYLNNKIDKKNLSNFYSKSKGIDWMLKKRIKSIHLLGLVNIDNNTIFYKNNFTKLLVKFSVFLKKLFNLGKGGE